MLSSCRSAARLAEPTPAGERHSAAMNTLAVLFVAQALSQQVQAPILEFPEAGLDDPAAYEGYATRFFRDSRGNTFQIYLNDRDGRVVHLWADAANESVAFTVRDPEGRPARLAWGGPGLEATSEGPRRLMRHRLTAASPQIEIGWFVLGTMRQERDFQYQEWHRRPYGARPFILDELTGLIASLGSLPPDVLADHLALLGAADVQDVRARLRPRLVLVDEGGSWRVRVEHTSLDGRNHLTLELHGDAETSAAVVSDDRVTVRGRGDGPIRLEVLVATDAAALTPLGRERLFNAAFEAYVAQQRMHADSLRRRLGPEEAERDTWLAAFRRFERQIRGLDLLSYEEKLIASLPNYATYFGRDQMMAALMLEPVSSADLQELVIASVLGKIAPSGNVSHEEALGEQAIRENAAEYSALVRAWERDRRSDPRAAAEHLARARDLLDGLQAVRENYRMVDDDFQLPVLVDRYLSREDLPAERKRRFLMEPSAAGRSRLEALLRNLAFVANHARPYAERPMSTNLVAFYHRDDDGWLPGSWRDSRAGYGNGRFAMDVNVLWVPHALEALARINGSMIALGLADEVAARMPADAPVLETYLREPETLRAALATWRESWRHFEVTVEPETIRTRVSEALAGIGEAERRYWRARADEADAAGRPLWFLAVSLDSLGQPIPVANTDPATDLVLGSHTDEIVRGAAEPTTTLRMLDVFTRPYPVGLLVGGVGPVVANDIYSSPAVRQRFRDDLYHSPRVVWGREVNLLLLGLTRQIASAYDASGRMRGAGDVVRPYVQMLRGILEQTRDAVEASGLSHNELWTYRIEGETLRAVRYGASSDIQLWNVTDLAVRFLLDALPPAGSSR